MYSILLFCSTFIVTIFMALDAVAGLGIGMPLNDDHNSSAGVAPLVPLPEDHVIQNSTSGNLGSVKLANTATNSVVEAKGEVVYLPVVVDEGVSENLLNAGLSNAVSSMLIAEANEVKRAENQQATAPQSFEGRPNKIQELMYSGLDDVLDENYKEAIPKLEKVINEEPTYLYVWSTLGWTYWRLGRMDDAIALWKKLLVLDEDNPLPHTLLGDAYIGTGELGKAEKHIKRSIELDPTRVDSRLKLGQVYRWTGRPQASIKVLKDLLKEYPDRLDVQNELALSLYANSDYDKALPLLKQGAQADPDNKTLALAYMRCLLHTGNIAEAESRAKQMLKDEDSPNMEVLLLLADAPRFRQAPEEAIPFLEKIADKTDDPTIKKQVLRRLIELYVMLWNRNPEKYPLDKAIEHARELVKLDPDSIDWRDTLSELMMLDARYVNAGDLFRNILKNGNTNSLRAHIGLCELYQATKKYKKAKQEFEKLRALNPKHPYWYFMQGRMEMSHANIQGAYDAADHLEAAGSHGAVAVLLYNGLSESDWDDTISARLFRLHMLALKQAGFKFITPNQLSEYFSKLKPPPKNLDDFVPRRVVMVTFDNPNERTVELATKVADDLDLHFAMNISAGLVDNGSLGGSGWALLRKYLKTGRWVVGSLLYDSIHLQPVNKEGALGSPLANRIWDKDAGIYESPLTYYKRLRDEYALSRKIIRENLGKENLVNFMAYPNGDLGQGDRSNVKDAIAKNLYEAAVNYEIGFIPSEFGYAVNGDNPLLYGRYAPAITSTGDDVVDHILVSHPVVVARRMRIAVAALDGRLYRAVHGLQIMRRDGYPAKSYEKLEGFVYSHLPMRFGMALAVEKTNRGDFDFRLEHPFAGLDFTWFKDSLHRKNWRLAGKGGLNITPSIRLEGRGGYGQFKQKYDTNIADADKAPVYETHKLKVKDSFGGGRIGFRYNPKNKKRSPVSLVAGAERHTYSGDADVSEWNYMADLAFRPFLPIDIRLQYNRDMVQSARSIVGDVMYDMYGYNGAYLIRDWWQIWNNFAYYDIDDGNGRFHGELTSLWEVHEEWGLNFGVSYDYVDAKNYEPDYWTPYRLNELWVIAKLRKNINEFYYDLTLRYGYAHEDIRPEDEEAYRLLVINANRWNYDPGPGPNDEWVEVWAASAALRQNIGRHWQAYCEGSYNEAPQYHEYRSLAGLILMY